MKGPLVTLGETLALLSTVEPGRLRHATRLQLSVGGAESNVAIGVCRLGHAAAWLGRVGDDELGALVVRTLRAEGVDVAGIRLDGGAPTSLMVKERRTATTTHVTYYRSHGPGPRLSPDDVDLDAVAGAGVLHTTGITLALSTGARSAVHHAVRRACDAGVPVSHDVNYRSALATGHGAMEQLAEIAPFVDHLFIGEDEARVLGVGADAEEVGRRLRALGAKTVVVKRAAEGARAFADGETVDMPGVPVDVVDPVGAGDAFAAGYLAQLLEGCDLEERMACAVRCGAHATTALGDWEGLPYRRDLARLQVGHEVLR